MCWWEEEEKLKDLRDLAELSFFDVRGRVEEKIDGG
jgi:hypothetical protein